MNSHSCLLKNDSQEYSGHVVGYSEYKEDPNGKAPIIKFKVDEKEYNQAFPLYESKVKYSINEEMKPLLLLSNF
jgi:hypothetical protein